MRIPIRMSHLIFSSDCPWNIEIRKSTLSPSTYKISARPRVDCASCSGEDLLHQGYNSIGSLRPGYAQSLVFGSRLLHNPQTGVSVFPKREKCAVHLQRFFCLAAE